MSAAVTESDARPDDTGIANSMAADRMAAVDQVQFDVTHPDGWESQIPNEFAGASESLTANVRVISDISQTHVDPPDREISQTHVVPSGDISLAHVDSSTSGIIDMAQTGTDIVPNSVVLQPNSVALQTPESPVKSWGGGSKSWMAFLARKNNGYRRSRKRISTIIEQERPGFTFEALELDETTGEMKKMQVQMGVWYHIRLTLQTTLMSLPFVFALILVSLFVPSGIPNCHLGKGHCHVEWALAQLIHSSLVWFIPAGICLGNVEWFMNWKRLKGILLWWFFRCITLYTGFCFVLAYFILENREENLLLFIIVGQGFGCGFFPWPEWTRLNLGYIEDYWDPRKMFADPDYEEKLKTQLNLVDLKNISWFTRKKNLLQKVLGTFCLSIGVIALVGLSSFDVVYTYLKYFLFWRFESRHSIKIRIQKVCAKFAQTAYIEFFDIH